MDNSKKNKLAENKTTHQKLSSDKIKRRYKKPRLLYYGGIKELTHSSTVAGTGDTSNPATRRR